MNRKLFIHDRIVMLISISLVILLAVHLTAQDKIVIKMATMAPTGSPWYEIIEEMGAKWAEASDGQIDLRLYPGGIVGDEGAIIRKMRIGQLQSGLISNTGLSAVNPAINALIIPLVINSNERLDYVRSKIEKELKAEFAKDGFLILTWVDAGWVRFFVPHSEPSLDKVQQAKLFVWAGDDKIVDLWKQAGFHAIPLAATDMLSALQTGMVNAFPTTAIIALANQWFAFTPYMIDLPWAPLVGALTINKRDWEKIPEQLRPKMLTIAQEMGRKIQKITRDLEQVAIEEMKKRGLIIITPDHVQRQRWFDTIKSIYPHFRGNVVPEKWFDKALSKAQEMENDTN